VTGAQANGGQDQGANGDAGGNQPQGGNTAAPTLSSGIAPQVSTASAASSGGQTADSASASTQSGSASALSGGTQTQVAPGLLGDPTPVQQVPVTAQGVGSANSGAATPPGMDTRTLALDPATGGSTALTGDVASAATAAATQGVVRTEGPGATSTGTASTSAFSLAQAATANPAEQVKVQVTKGLKDGSDSIDVLLHPADLGTVQVKLQMQDGQVKATITADNPQTLALLKNDAHQLTQSLQNAGFDTDSNSLNFQMRSDQQSQGSAFAQQQADQGGSGAKGENGSDSGSNSSPYTTDSEIDEQVLAATSGGGDALSGLDIKV
jgi:flagellar hook-length control protein FliK